MTANIIQLVHQRRRVLLHSATSTHSAENDNQLLKRFVKHHDESAFEELVHRYGSLVLSVAKRIVREHQAAEDVLQATFFVLARKAGSINWKATIAPWLYATAYRLACNARKRRPATSALKSEPSHVPHQALLWNETCQLLDEEMMKLSEPTRAALVLCYLEGKTRDEAAQLLGLSLATLKRRLEQGRHLLRDRLTRRGLSFSATGWGLLLSLTELNAATIRSVTQTALATSLPASAAMLIKAGVSWTLPSILFMVLGLGAISSTWWLALPVHSDAHAPSIPVIQPILHEDAPKLDTHGDPLPEGALARLGTIRFRPGQMLHDMAFAPDRRFLAGWMHGYLISQGKNRLVYWDATTGQEMRSLDMPKNNLLCMRWLPDGRLLALTRFAHGYYHLCEFAPGKETTFPEVDGNSLNSMRSGDIRSAAISPDGKWIATGRRSGEGEHQSIELWEAKPNASLEDQKPIQLGSYPGHGLYLQFSDDGKHLVAICRAQGAHIQVPSEQRVICQPVGGLMEGPWEEKATAMIFDVASRKHLRSFKVAPPQGYSEMFPPPQRMAMTKDGSTLYIGSEIGKVHAYDCQTGKETLTLQVYQKPEKITRDGYGQPLVASLAVSHDGRTLYASTWNGNLQEWDIAKKVKRRTMTEPDWVSHIALSSDGQKLVTASPSITTQLAIYDTATGQHQGNQSGHQFYVAGMTLLPDGQLLTSATDRQLIWWDLKNSKEIKRQTCPLLPGPKGLLSYSEQAGGLFGYTSDRRKLGFYDLNGQTTVCTDVTREGDFVRFISHSGAGMFYANKAGLLHFWDAKTKSLKQTYPNAIEGIASNLTIDGATISPDQRTVAILSSGLITGENNNSYRCSFLAIHDAVTGKQRYFWYIPQHSRMNAQFTPDGKRLLVTGQFLGKQFAPTTPAENTLSMPEDKAAALFDLESGRLLQAFDTPDKQSWMPSTTLFTQDSCYLAIAWLNARISYYETATGKLLRTYAGHRGDISTLRFLPGEQKLISASDDGTCLIWDVSPKALAEGKKTKD